MLSPPSHLTGGQADGAHSDDAPAVGDPEVIDPATTDPEALDDEAIEAEAAAELDPDAESAEIVDAPEEPVTVVVPQLDPTDTTWWKSAVFYQIYPRSSATRTVTASATSPASSANWGGISNCSASTRSG